MLTLMKTLALLSEALPLALAHIGSCAIEVQENFWRSFHEFDRMTDLTIAKDDPDHATAMAMLIEDWRQVVETRAYTPTGDLRETGPEPE